MRVIKRPEAMRFARSCDDDRSFGARIYVGRCSLLAAILTAGLAPLTARAEASHAQMPVNAFAAADSTSVPQGSEGAVGSGASNPDHTPGGVQTSSAEPGSFFGLSSGKGPIHIQSDSLSFDYKDRIALFRGRVYALQSGTELRSDLLQISYGKDFNDIKQVIADHNVRITQGQRWATGDHAVLDQVARTVEMTGNPIIHDGPDQIAGTKILMYLDTQKSVVESAHAVIFPHKQQTRDNDEASGETDQTGRAEDSKR